jgi:hypothetical protein
VGQAFPPANQPAANNPLSVLALGQEKDDHMHLHKSALSAVILVCALLAPVTANANDLQSGDLLIGAAVPFGFGGLGNGAILLVRNGTVSVFCQSPSNGAAAGYFADPIGVIADSAGRAVFLAEVGVGLPVFAAGTALLRCDGIGATAEMLGYFPSTAATAPAPGYPLVVIPGVLASGLTYQSNGAEAATASALHLIGLHTVSLTDLFAGVKTQDAYSLVVNPQGIGATSIRYRATDQIWEADTQVMSLSTGDIDVSSIDAISHSGATYSTNGDNILKVQDPLTLEASGTILGTSFSATLNLFASSNTFPPTPAGGQPAIEYNTAIPQTPSGCFPPAPPLDNSMPTNSSGGLLIPFVGSGFGSVLYDEFTGFGLIITTDYGPSEGPWLTNISEDLLDNPGDPTQYFQDGFAGCVAVPFVPMSVPLPYFGVSPPPTGFVAGNSTSYKPASTINGPVAVQFSSTLPGGTDVIGLVAGTNAPIVVTGTQLTNAGFAGAHSIGAYPNGVSAGTGLTIFLRVDSPVNILITDPNGKKLGVDSLGNAHNDFSGTLVNSVTGGSENFNNGFDSGPGEPRFFGIKNPASGTYNVQSIGTGSGPYTVHVYSANLANPTGQAISTSGTASLGSPGSESFTLDTLGNIAFTCAGNVGAEVGVIRSGYSYSVVTKRYAQTITLTNNGTSSIAGPISLVLDNLASNASLFNSAGTTACAAPLGSPYVTIPGPLAPGASATAVLQFTDPTKAGITYTTRVLAGGVSQ